MSGGSGTCASCGRPTSTHERNIRFRLPEPVLDSELQERAPGTWLAGTDADQAVMMVVPEIGGFLRALLPVTLVGGDTVTYGVWVAVSPEDLHHAFDVWWAPAYADLRIEGYVANRVEPWGLLGAPVVLEVRDVDVTPYCVASPVEDLQEVLTREWAHDLVLGTLPS